MHENRFADFEDFIGLDIRVGKVLSVSDLENARNSAFVLHIDFGKDVGVLKSSAQITDLYEKDQIIDKQVVAVVNFEPKQIGNIMSECLVLGVTQANGVALLVPDMEVEIGEKIG